MSTILSLKQLLCQLDSSDLERVLDGVSKLQGKSLELQVLEKGYRCVQADILTLGKKTSSGFGKSESEAVANARRTALEGLIDHAEPHSYSRVKAILLNKEKENKLTGGNELAEENKVKFRQRLKHLLGLDEPPSYLLCPLSKELMHDPVTTVDGHSYERQHIETWLRTSCKSPVTGKELISRILRPNHALKQALDHYRNVRQQLGPKQRPRLTSGPLKNLYEAVYGHHFEDAIEDLPSEEARVLSARATKAIQGEFDLQLPD